MQNTIPVPNNNSMPFDDREMLNDALISQKQLTSDYNAHVNESATPEAVSYTHLDVYKRQVFKNHIFACFCNFIFKR